MPGSPCFSKKELLEQASTLYSRIQKLSRRIKHKRMKRQRGSLTPAFENTLSSSRPQHQVFEDGSHTSPTNWWAALGGFGFWKPAMPHDTEREAPPGVNLPGGFCNLTLPLRHQYATDSAALIARANKIIAAAEAAAPCNPFKKAWGLQRDGDL